MTPQQPLMYEEFDHDMGVGMDVDAPPSAREDSLEDNLFDENVSGAASPPPAT